MSYENNTSSAESRAAVSRRIASVMRLGGHMRLRPETRTNGRFRFIEATRAAKVDYDERSSQSSDTQPAIDANNETDDGVEGAMEADNDRI